MPEIRHANTYMHTDTLTHILAPLVHITWFLVYAGGRSHHTLVASSQPGRLLWVLKRDMALLFPFFSIFIFFMCNLQRPDIDRHTMYLGVCM